MSLTPKQETFATGLAAGLSQAEAYRQAFPNSRKWKDEAVYSRASALAATDKVQQRVQELGQKAAAANEVTIERIVKELAKIAFGNSRDVMEWGPNGVKLKDSKDLDDGAAAMVSEVAETTSLGGGSLKLKTHDKVAALRILGEHVGMFPKKMELTGKGGKDLVPEAPKGVLVVPGVMSSDAWEDMMAKQRQEAGQ